MNDDLPSWLLLLILPCGVLLAYGLLEGMHALGWTILGAPL